MTKTGSSCDARRRFPGLLKKLSLLCNLRGDRDNDAEMRREDLSSGAWDNDIVNIMLLL